MASNDKKMKIIPRSLIGDFYYHIAQFEVKRRTEETVDEIIEEIIQDTIVESDKREEGILKNIYKQLLLVN
jgi:hypothetical protein